MGQYASFLSNWTVCPIAHAKMTFFSLPAKNLEFLVCWLKKRAFFSQILLKLWLIGNETSCRPIRSVIIPVIKQIGLPLRGRQILLITRMITNRIGLHSVQLPLQIGLHSVLLQLPICISGMKCHSSTPGDLQWITKLSATPPLQCHILKNQIHPRFI